MTLAEKENTLFIFIGDNGTPGNFLRHFPDEHGKGTLYQGGIHVPMFVSGYGVTRAGERDSSLIHVNDIHATVLEMVGGELEGGIYNSLSFKHLLDGSEGPTKNYNYSELESDEITGCTIRNQQYKLIIYEDGTQEFFDLYADSLEFTNLLLGTLSTEEEAMKEDLEIEAAQIKNDWSCRDHIKNGDEEGIDCGGTFCDPCDLGITKTQESSFNLYPNPAKDILFIERGNQMDSEEHLLVELRDLTGRLITSYKLTPNQSQISLKHFTLADQLFLINVSSEKTNYGSQLLHIKTSN